jgi:hypothetical protein
VTAQDLLPRQFQADCDRFYMRVIAPALATMQPGAPSTITEFASVSEFLNASAKSTFNLLAYEARRSFALTLGAIFERQLRIWARVHFTASEEASIPDKKFYPLLDATVAKHGLDLRRYAIGTGIRELYLLANAVRHGDGFAVTELRSTASQLWPDLTPSAIEKCHAMAIWSEAIQLSDADLTRYAEATTRFWGIADRVPGAMIDALTRSEFH